MVFAQDELGQLMRIESGENTGAGLLISPLIDKEEPAMDSTIPDSECFDPLNDMLSNESLIVPVDKCEVYSSGSESAEPSNKSLAITELVREVFERLHKRKPYFCTQNNEEKNNENGSSSVDPKARCRNLSAGANRKTIDKRRERWAKETAEETEFRLLRQRMVTMKSRLIQRLEAPDKIESRCPCEVRDVRERRMEARARETAEEIAERKKKQADQVRKSRQRIRAIETPEQKSERKRREALRRKELQSQETPEVRAARLERQRNYLKKSRLKSVANNGTVSARTGKLCKTHNRKKTKQPAKTDTNACDGVRNIELISSSSNLVGVCTALPKENDE